MVKLKKKHINIFIIFLASGLFFSCERPFFKDDPLHVEQTYYAGDNLKINGYYYRVKDSSAGIFGYFFYRNGVVLDADARGEDDYTSEEWLKHEKNTKSSWGVFRIQNKTIKYEMWEPSEPPLRAYVREGIIINDTTFLITESYRLQNGKKRDQEVINQFYHFKQFSPKPDSTNPYIE